MAEHNKSIISTFWEIYRNLDKNEKKEFSVFVESSIFNKKNALKSILQACVHFEKERVVFDRQTLYAKAFHGKEINKQVLNNYFVELKKLLLQFLQIRWVSNKPSLHKWALAEMYLQKGLFQHFEKLEEQTFKNTEISAEESFFNYRLQSLFDEYAATHAKKKTYTKLNTSLLQFNTFYFLESLRMYCELVNRKNLRIAAFDEKAMKTFLSYYESSLQNRNQNPLLEIYYFILLFLLDEKNEKAFAHYKNNLKEYLHQIPMRTARDICLFGQNFCIKHINLNKQNYLHELFELYNLMLQHRVIYDGQYMTEWTFKNYITVALRLQAFDEAEQFIEVYHDKLLPDVRFNAFHYNLAALYYEKNDFVRAMDELNKIHFRDTVYYLDARSILLKIYFAEEDFEALASLYHSVRVYLLRNKQVSRKQADLYRNLFLYTHKLAALLGKRSFVKETEYAEAHVKLLKKVEQNAVANKNWLIKNLTDAA
ncbi:MAG: hypothetical protein H7Y00_09770 [Fimbriimonadaceae bacterium]|nr:hypothetical protein [Chitinophagales bacterium]